MELDYENLQKMISIQVGYYRERSLNPEEIRRRFRYHSAKYTEYVAECDDGSWISHYINKKALETLAEEQGIEIISKELEINKKTGKTR